MYKIFTKTLFIGKKLVYEPICQSTNSLACQFASQLPLFDGAVFITDEQTAGKGQRGNRWQTDKGKNLTFSILLAPKFLNVGEQFFLSAAVSMGLAAFLQERFQLPAKVKWPNDIMVGEKKVCGILIENSLKGKTLAKSVIGIGLNVNQTAFEGLPRASSLSLLLGRELPLAETLEEACKHIERFYLMLRQGKKAEVLTRYQDELFRRGKEHEFIDVKGGAFLGCIEGVLPSGHLQIRTEESGLLRSFAFKEVSFKDFKT